MTNGYFKLLLPVLLGVTLAGCAVNKKITVNTVPSGGEVSIDGRRLGKAPVTFTTNDIMPDRANDGRLSTQALLTVTKPGYEEYTLMLREFDLPKTIDVQLEAMGIAENFQNYLDQNPTLLDATIPNTAAPSIHSTEDLDADSERLYRNGFLLVAYSGFSADGIAVESVVGSHDLGTADRRVSHEHSPR